MKKTKAQQLGITRFPYQEFDINGNQTYYEHSNGYWWKYEYDSEGNETHYEDSDGYWEKKEYDEYEGLIYIEDSDNGIRLNTRTSSNKMDMASCMLSILDSLKLYDNGTLVLNGETLSEMMFRKMKGYNIDLNKELGMTHLKPVTKK